MNHVVSMLIQKQVLSLLTPIDIHQCYQVSGIRALTELLLPLDLRSHKGHFGHILIVEGHPNFLGASRLAALAAIRSGAGLVSLLSKDEIHFHPQDYFEFMHLSAHHLKADHFKKFNAIVVGPGLSKDPQLQDFALTILKIAMATIPVIVVDAEALALLERLNDEASSATIICTPHPKEAAMLLGSSAEEVENDRIQAILNLSRLRINQKHSIIWLLKGSSTLLMQKGVGIFYFKGNAPMLATGGSGDVLAGSIASLSTQTHHPLSATLLAISLTLAAAHEASDKADRGFLPSELANTFPSLLKRPVW